MPAPTYKAKFVVAEPSRGNAFSSHTTRSAALASAAKYVNDASYRNVSELGIYQLTSIVKRKVVPVEVIEIACCEGVK